MPVDIVSFGETMFRLNALDGSRLEDVDRLQAYVAGTESNTLAALARLGLNVTWMSALPANPLGRRVEGELRLHGVDTSHVVWMKGARLGIFYSEEAASPLGVQVHYDRANSACALIDPLAVDYAVVDTARMLHLTGITPALSTLARQVFRRFLQRARDAGVPLSFDVNYRARLWSPEDAALHIEEACRQARLLFCTQADAAELWGMTGSAEEVLRQMAERFSDGSDESARKIFVLTLGKDGAAQLQGDSYTTAPVFPLEGTARFGSGDAFAAGYLYAYLDGPLYREIGMVRSVGALVFGNALAALKRCIAGDIAVIGPDDVRALLLGDGGGRFR
jgi:2-dehydro-3-deoxygluconokinase